MRAAVTMKTEEPRCAWMDAAKALDARLAAEITAADLDDPIQAIKAVVLSAYIGETIALRDRNHHNYPWQTSNREYLGSRVNTIGWETGPRLVRQTFV